MTKHQIIGFVEPHDDGETAEFAFFPHRQRSNLLPISQPATVTSQLPETKFEPKINTKWRKEKRRKKYS